MNLKILMTSVNARFDHLLTCLEHHDAAAAAAVSAMAEALARTRSEREHVRRDINTWTKGHTECIQTHKLWAERAKGSHAEKPELALECMRRAIQADKRREDYEQRLQRARELERKLSVDVDHCEKQLIELRQRRQELRSREARSAGSALAVHGGENAGEIFQRWEHKIMRQESLNGDPTVESLDSVEAEFDQAEEAQHVRLALDLLMQESAPANKSVKAP